MKVVCTALGTEHGPHLEILDQAGFEVVQVPRHFSIYDATNLIPVVRDCVAVVAGSEPWSASTLASCPQLRVLARTGVGFDAIDMAACDQQRVIVATTPGVNHEAVAEHTIAMLMGVARLFPARDQDIRTATWKRVSTPRVMGRTLGIVGLGRIGQAVATRAIGLGLNVVAYESFPRHDFCDRWKIELASFEELLSRSDYVTLHLPMTQETKHLMNAKTFRLMKPGSVLLNTARGLLVDETALVESLQSGHLRGAGLDVFEVEPLPNTSPLLKMGNVLLSGHVAGLDDEAQYDTLKLSAETIVSLFHGGWPSESIRNLVGAADWKWSEKD